MNKWIYIFLILITMYLLALNIKIEKCWEKPMSEAYQDSFCKSHWNRLYG